MTKAKDDLRAEFVRSILSYDPDTGEVRWKPRSDRARNWNTKYAGTLAGFRSKSYIVITIGKGCNYYAHRLAWMIVFGCWPSEQIDHLNSDRCDNRLANLRCATNSENGCNKPLQRNNSSGFPGVWFNSQRGKWEGQIVKDGKREWRRFFDSAAEAHITRQAHLREFHGEFARI